MIAGAILGLLVVLGVFAYRSLGKKGQENVRKTGNVAGWIFWLFVLFAIFYSSYLTLSK